MGAGRLAGAAVRETLRQLLYEQTSRRAGYRLAMTGLARQMLAMLARASAQPDTSELAGAHDKRAAMAAYVRRLETRFFEAGTIDAAATQLGMSRRRFTELFRELTGSTWTDYVRARRIEHACRLLGGTRRSIVSIAFECGFHDLSTFYRAFKREIGQSPAAWRGAGAA